VHGVEGVLRIYLQQQQPGAPVQGVGQRLHAITTSQGLPFAKAVCMGARAAVALRHWDVACSHLAVILRIVSPTAIVRTPPSFFLSGMRRAAHRYGADPGLDAARTDRRDNGHQGLQLARIGGTVRAIQAVEQVVRSQPRGDCRTPWGNERTTSSIARSWSAAHEGVTSRRSSGSGAASSRLAGAVPSGGPTLPGLPSRRH